MMGIKNYIGWPIACRVRGEKIENQPEAITENHSGENFFISVWENYDGVEYYDLYKSMNPTYRLDTIKHETLVDLYSGSFDAWVTDFICVLTMTMQDKKDLASAINRDIELLEELIGGNNVKL